MSNTKFILGMRDAFFNELYKLFQQDQNAVFITADTGAPTLDRFAQDFPKRYFNVGIAEEQLIGMAAGMAFEGKKVYTYAIAPFISLRCYEQNKIDVCAMNLPIVILGVGAGYAYDIMGPTHHAVEDISVMRTLPNLVIYSPSDGISAAYLARTVHYDRQPQYVRFDRAGLPDLYTSQPIKLEDGLHLAKPGNDVCIIATGVMVHNALKVSDYLKETTGLNVGIIDLFRLKPINKELLLAYLGVVKHVVTYEEHLLAGGMGSAIAEIFVDEGFAVSMLRIGQQDRFVFDNGGRQVIWEKYGLDVASVTTRIAQWLNLRLSVKNLLDVSEVLPQTHD